ncbi:uncharacterized protein LOC135334440 isoform X2 [Halichondria panicea]|uniref:uncharacterized protein LOC135334440 isoform X2 n=1 Tax=Halichondria panicea TaxID=6063 RepID=UPI00312B3AEA
MLKLQALLRPNFVSTFPLKCSLSKSGENEIELTKGVLRGIISELKEDMPRALSAVGLLKNALEGRVLCKLHTDSWPSFNTLVCQVIYPRASEVADLLCYSRGSGDDLLQLLLSQNLISWRKKQQIYYLESELSDYLCEHLVDPSTGRKVLSNFLEGVAAYLPNNKTEMPCPDGFVLGSLKPHHTPLVVKHWDRLRGWPKEMSYYEGLISNFESRALYSVDDLDSPVTWSLQHVYGSIGGLFSIEAFRENSLGSFVAMEMSKAVAAQGLTPWSVLQVENTTMRKMSAKLGGLESKYTLKRSALGL